MLKILDSAQLGEKQGRGAALAHGFTGITAMAHVIFFEWISAASNVLVFKLLQL